jgi:cell division initiation protein
MAATPHEIRTVELPRAILGGYRREEADQLLDDVADSFAEAIRERDQLRDRVKALEDGAAGQAELETLLRSTLVSAERASQESKAQARRESDLIVQEAHAEARRVTRQAAAERRRIEEDLIEIAARLRAALETLSTSAVVSSEPEQEAAPATSGTQIEDDLESRLREVTA